jgi:O-antigen ligase
MSIAQTYSAPSRSFGRTDRTPLVAGTTMLAVALAMHVAPRGDWLYLAVLTAALFYLLLAQGWRLTDARLPTPTALLLMTFGLVAMAGEFWSAAPGKALLSGGVFLFLTGLGAVSSDAIAHLRPAVVRRASFGLLIGFAAGISFLIFECLTNFALQRLVLSSVPGLIRATDHHLHMVRNHLASIDHANIKRHMAQAALLLWPVVLLALTFWRGWQGRVAGAGVVMATLVAGLLARHDSSNLALVTGLAAALAAAVSFRWTWRVVTLTWLVLTLFVVPLMLWQFDAKLYQRDWIQQTGRHRLVIWGYTAEQVGKAPILGIGAGSGKALDAKRTDVEQVPGQEFEFRTADHQHDFYLQTWYEMGLLGALVLCFAGLTALWRLRRLPHDVRGFALATFVSAMFLVSTSYGLWQEWFVASLAIAAVALTLAVRLAAPQVFESPQDALT